MDYSLTTALRRLAEELTRLVAAQAKAQELENARKGSR